MTDRQPNSHFLDHPETREAFDIIFTILIHESARGALLVGADIVDQHLGKLFDAIRPTDLPIKKFRGLLKYPGCLSSFAARTEIAYIMRLIGKNLYDAISKLRCMRNRLAAHSHDPLILQNHMEAVRRISANLGSTLPAFINKTAAKTLINSVVKHVIDAKSVSDEIDSWPSEPREVLDRITESPEVMKSLQSTTWRLELGLTIGFICALITFYREKSSLVLADNRLICSLEPIEDRARPSV